MFSQDLLLRDCFRVWVHVCTDGEDHTVDA